MIFVFTFLLIAALEQTSKNSQDIHCEKLPNEELHINPEE